jgi:hypothetical protein
LFIGVDDTGGVFATYLYSLPAYWIFPRSPFVLPNLHRLMSTLETQVGGNHYKKFKIQPIEFIVANDIPYRPANVIKYVCRYKDKNGLEDLKKARHYLDMLIEEEEANVTNETKAR